ncbi:MAG TPA: hypothetical protein PKE14_14450, partial [Chitinophagales bacterium]|nr:hypothetical protein [Chitinophagales bacterium]
MDIVTSNDTGYFNSIRDMLYNFFMKRGVLLRPLGNTIYIMPPYCITNEALDEVYNAILDALALLAEGKTLQ